MQALLGPGLCDRIAQSPAVRGAGRTRGPRASQSITARWVLVLVKPTVGLAGEKAAALTFSCPLPRQESSTKPGSSPRLCLPGHRTALEVTGISEPFARGPGAATQPALGFQCPHFAGCRAGGAVFICLPGTRFLDGQQSQAKRDLSSLGVGKCRDSTSWLSKDRNFQISC